jgi:hypothetical protein
MYAQELDIEIIFAPTGRTGDFQPLNRRINMGLKSHAIHEFKTWREQVRSLHIPCPNILEVVYS